MRISTRVAAVGAAAAIAATSLVAMLPAGAAPAVGPTTTTTVAGPQQVTANVDGSLAVNAASDLNLTVPMGSKFAGTFDRGTGALSGSFSWGTGGTLTGLSLTLPVLGAATADLTYGLTSAGTATGTVDPLTNAVTLTDTESFALKGLDVTTPALGNIPFAAGCVVTPINLTYTGTYDPATKGVDITSAHASLPTIPAGGCGEYAGAVDLTGPVNGLLSGATATAHLTFRLTVEAITPPAPTTTTPKAPTTTVASKAKAPAPAAKPISGANPTFTG